MPAVTIARYKTSKGETHYRLRWRDPRTGNKASEDAGSDRVFARSRRRRKEQELIEGVTKVRPQHTISSFERVLGTLMSGKSPVTISKTRRSLLDLIQVIGDMPLANLGREQIMMFRANRVEKGAKAATVNKDLRQIKSSLSYARDAEYISENPMSRWRGSFLREPEREVRVVEPEEFQKLLDACETEVLKVLLKIAYYQGLRRTELANLRWDAVDLDKGTLRVRNVEEAGELTKSRKNRTVPLRAAAKESLAQHLKNAPRVIEGGKLRLKSPYVFVATEGGHGRNAGGKLIPDWLSHWFPGVVARAGIKHCTLHDLRRSFSTLLQRAGVDRSLVKDLGGWSCLQVVERHYTGEIQPALRRAMELMDRAG